MRAARRLRARARISMALGDRYEPRPGETWSADLDQGCFAFKAGEEALFAGPCRLLDHAHHSEWQLQLANLYRELRQPGALQRAHRNN